MKKYLCPPLIVLSFLTAMAQNTKDFTKEIKENKFVRLKVKKIPIGVLQVLGADSYGEVGTRKTQTGCTSGKKIVINWAVTDNADLCIFCFSTCGAYSETRCVFVSGESEFPADVKPEPKNFEEFKKKYLSKKNKDEGI